MEYCEASRRRLRLPLLGWRRSRLAAAVAGRVAMACAVDSAVGAFTATSHVRRRLPLALGCGRDRSSWPGSCSPTDSVGVNGLTAHRPPRLGDVATSRLRRAGSPIFGSAMGPGANGDQVRVMGTERPLLT